MAYDRVKPTYLLVTYEYGYDLPRSQMTLAIGAIDVRQAV